jgi:hypothetical protein
MNTDFRIELGFFTHPKTLKLRRRLGDTGIVDLLQLFAFAACNRPDGDLGGMDDESISIAAGQCEIGAVAVFYEIGFLEGEEGRRRIHDWNDHNPYAATAQERSEKARQAAYARWGLKSSTREPRNGSGAQSARSGLPENATNNAKPSNEQYSEHDLALPLASFSNAPPYPPSVSSVSSDTNRTSETTTTTPGCINTPNAPAREAPAGGSSSSPDRSRSLPEGRGDPPPMLGKAIARGIAVKKLAEQGVSEKEALDLFELVGLPAIEDQLAWLPARLREKEREGKPVAKPRAWLVRSIRESWAKPDGLLLADLRKRDAAAASEETAARKRRAAEAARAEDVRKRRIAAYRASLPPADQQRVAGQAQAQFRIDNPKWEKLFVTDGQLRPGALRLIEAMQSRLVEAMIPADWQPAPEEPPPEASGSRQIVEAFLQGAAPPMKSL